MEQYENEEQNQVLFELPMEIEMKKSRGTGKRIVKGYASTEAMDQDGEVVLKNGIDFKPLLKSGFLNYDHQAKCLQCGTVSPFSKCPSCGNVGARMPLIIGYPTVAHVDSKGLWLEGEIITPSGETRSEQGRLADEMWELGMALQKSGGLRSLCYSVEGGVLQRHGKKVVKSVVRHCAITHKPVNQDATLQCFRKSMCCGRCHPTHPLYTAGHKCGSHDHPAEEAFAKALGTDTGTPMANGNGPMMRENLDRGFTTLLYGTDQLATPCGCYDPDTMAFKEGIPGAVEHLKKCRGASHQEAVDFLRKAVGMAGGRPDISATLKAAGIIR